MKHSHEDGRVDGKKLGKYRDKINGAIKITRPFWMIKTNRKYLNIRSTHIIKTYKRKQMNTQTDRQTDRPRALGNVGSEY